MNNFIDFKHLCLFVLCITLQNCVQTKKVSSGEENSKYGFYTADDFKTVEKYDTHAARLLYATDQVVAKDSDFGELKKSVHDTKVSDWKFFATKDEMRVSDFDGRFKGLKLPRDVIDKIYRKNAEKWFPGI